jgi:PAT family beta-lactamase induction signal transducer AmpG
MGVAPLMTLSHTLAWVALLYFAEGFPFGILNDALPVYFRLHGVRLADIGLLSLVGLPWTLKVFWAPAVDLWGTRRAWIVGCQALLAGGLIALLLLDPTRVSGGTWMAMGLLALAAATQDIAIDACTIELVRPEDLGPANGVRVTAYRVALIASGGLFVALAGLTSWPAAFAGAALLMAASCLVTTRLPAAPIPARPGGAQTASRLERAVWEPLHQFVTVPGFLIVACFVLTYKLGDMALGPMIRPFWVDRQFTPVQIGAIPGTLGVVSTICGALLGGVLTKRWGVFRALWILGIAQAGSNLMYAAAAARPPSAPLMYASSIVESFCGGLGTSPFLALLMRLCDKTHAATQYALLSALFGLTRVVAGAFSGWATEGLGYALYFTLTCFLAWPALFLIPRVADWTARRETGARGTPAGP